MNHFKETLKKGIVLSLLIGLAGCSATKPNQGITANSAEPTSGSTTTPSASSPPSPSTSPVSTLLGLPSSTPSVAPGQTLSESDAIELIKSKLSDEIIQRSSLRVNGTDEQGNYVVTLSNSATTEVMEWYHVNPTTNEVTCEILADQCLEKEESAASTEPSELTPDQSKALQLAKEYAKQNLGPGYVEDSTFISFDHEEEGKPVFQVYNLGAGGTQTLDWLTVDLDSNKVTAMSKE